LLSNSKEKALHDSPFNHHELSREEATKKII
jgi:hypothetical protein